MRSRRTYHPHLIIDVFYGAYETMVREVPEDHAMDYAHVYLTVVKS